MEKSRTLHILMNGMAVGTLEKAKRGGLIFTYDPAWLQTPGARPLSLSLPLVSESYAGDVVYNFFDNLLPDNPQIRARIQAKFQVATSQPFDLLAAIGKDCVGAIQIIDGDVSYFKKQIKFEPLNEREISSLLNGYYNSPLGMEDSNSDFRISIAGAQEKAAFLYYKKKWCRPLQETPTSHIFKLPIGYIQHQQMDLTDSCENEWLCLQIAKAFGLPSAQSEILRFKDTKVLVVERFDRKLASNGSWLMRLPQEDMCQALGVSPNLKYQADGGIGITEIMKLLLGSVASVSDRDTFYQSQVLFWLIAAIDGHAKNFSLFIEPGGGYRLTPLYDVMSAAPLIMKGQLQAKKIKMAMALKGKNMHYHWHNIQRRHFLETADKVNYSVEKAEIFLDRMLDQVDQVIEEVSTNLPLTFPENISRPIFECMRQMKVKLSAKSSRDRE